MASSSPSVPHGRVRGHTDIANSLQNVASQTAKLWRKHHLTYDQTKHVVEQTRRQLGLKRLASGAEQWNG